jgi:hypothetical protein
MRELRFDGVSSLSQFNGHSAQRAALIAAQSRPIGTAESLHKAGAFKGASRRDKSTVGNPPTNSKYMSRATVTAGKMPAFRKHRCMRFVRSSERKINVKRVNC